MTIAKYAGTACCVLGLMMLQYTSASAQVVVEAKSIATVAEASGDWTLPVNTEITVTPNNDLTTKSLKEGDTFTITTVYDVLMNNYIVIPRGTRGQGRVTWRTGKSAFGKSAKMELAFDWIVIGDKRVAIEGKHRQEGDGNTGATIGAVVAVGPFAGFVTGKSAVVPRGMQLTAFTAEPITVRVAGLSAAPTKAEIVTSSPVVTQGTITDIQSVGKPDEN